MSYQSTLPPSPAHVIWLTGISGAGKTTLATRLLGSLRSKGTPVEFLDGDVVRGFFENDLGYSRHERLLNVRRIAFAAKLLADHGVTVIVANIAPYYEVRDFVRKKLANYLQIYCSTSVEQVAKRDVKGLYSLANDGVGPLIGVDDVYDIPRNPDLTIHTNLETEDESFLKLLQLMEEKGIL